LEVSWHKAEPDLADIDPPVVDQLKRNAEELLHDIPPWKHEDDGVRDGIMWHRGAAGEWPEEQSDGPQNYFLFYQKSRSGHDFEILAVRSLQQVSARWLRLAADPHRPFY
jgi:hypothetical protein